MTPAEKQFVEDVTAAARQAGVRGLRLKCYLNDGTRELRLGWWSDRGPVSIETRDHEEIPK